MGKTLGKRSSTSVANATMMRVETMMQLVPEQSVAEYKALYANWYPRAQEVAREAAGIVMSA